MPGSSSLELQPTRRRRGAFARQAEAGASPKVRANATLPKVGALWSVLVLAGLVPACGDDVPLPLPDERPAPEAAPDAEPPAEVEAPVSLERAVVFLAQETDPTLSVPWTFRTRRAGDQERRLRGAWLARAGSWEALTTEEEEGPATRGPWRILPGRTIRLLMGPVDALERLVLRTPTRQAEAAPGMLLSEWSGPSGEIVRLHRGTFELPGEEREGFILDLTLPAREEDLTPPDWIFVHGGAEFQAAFLETSPVADPRSPGRFRAWTRVAVREAVWPEIRVEWDEIRAFEDARRDIPVRWTLSSPGLELEGELEAEGSHLTAGGGEGPILPLDGFFQVRGEVRVEGEAFAVIGLLHHRQR